MQNLSEGGLKQFLEKRKFIPVLYHPKRDDNTVLDPSYALKLIQFCHEVITGVSNEKYKEEIEQRR
jgi:hypothetical protein